MSLTVNRALSRVQLVDSVFRTSINRDLGLPIKLQLVSRASSGGKAQNSAFFSSCQRVSGLLSSSGGEFGLLQEDQHGSQASHHVVRVSSVFHWSPCRGFRTYLELRGNSVSFFFAAESVGFHSRFNRSDRLPLVVRGEVGILLELKQEMGPHLKRRWETRGASRLLAGNSDFISSCDGVSGPP